MQPSVFVCILGTLIPQTHITILTCESEPAVKKRSAPVPPPRLEDKKHYVVRVHAGHDAPRFDRNPISIPAIPQR